MAFCAHACTSLTLIASARLAPANLRPVCV